MTFQTPIPNSVSIDRAALSNLEVTRVKASEDLLKTLEIGKTLQVKVTLGRDGSSGLNIQGNFVPAYIPEGFKPGDNLSVKVLQNSDVLVLKILSSGAQLSDGSSAESFEQVLRNLLTPSTLEALKLSSLPLKEFVSREISKFPESPVGRELSSIIERLFLNHVVLGEEGLQNPDLLQRILSNLGQNEILRTLQEAKQAVESLSRQTVSPKEAKLLAALEQHIESLLNSKNSLGFNQEPQLSSPALRDRIKLLLSFSEYAAHTSNSNALAELSKQVGKLQASSNPLSNLLLGLRSFQLPEQTGAFEQPSNISDFIKNLTAELQTLQDRRLPEKEVREVLGKILKSIRETFESPKSKASETSLLEEKFNTFKALNNILSGQEVINNLNPLMHSLGEPLLFLIPFFTDGLLAKWEMSVDSKRVQSPDENGKKSTSNANGYTQVKLSLSFPHIGDVQVDLAHKDQEILLTLAFKEVPITQHVNPRLEQLTLRFKELGYNDINLQTKTEVATHATPVWYRDLLKRSVVA